MNGPDPTKAANTYELAACMCSLRTLADNPSYRELEKLTGDKGGLLPGTKLRRAILRRTMLSDVLAGKLFPSKAFLLTFVEACGVDLETDPRWGEVWNRLAIQSQSENVDPGAHIEMLLQKIAAAEQHADETQKRIELVERERDEIQAQLSAAVQMHARENAAPYSELPDVLPLNSLSSSAHGLKGMSLGIGEQTSYVTIFLDFNADPHFFIFGNTECGKSNVLRLIADGVTNLYAPKEARLIFIDYRRSLLDSAETDHQIGYATSPAVARDLLNDARTALAERLPPPNLTPAQLRSRSWWKGSDLFLIVDDYELVAEQDNPLLVLADLLPLARDIGVHVVLARSAAGAGIGMADPIIRRIRDMGSPGLIMSGDQSEGELLGGVSPRPLRPGRGILVNRRTGTRLVQTALAGNAVGS